VTVPARAVMSVFRESESIVHTPIRMIRVPESVIRTVVSGRNSTVTACRQPVSLQLSERFIGRLLGLEAR
jgi:hypothetical protein